MSLSSSNPNDDSKSSLNIQETNPTQKTHSLLSIKNPNETKLDSDSSSKTKAPSASSSFLEDIVITSKDLKPNQISFKFEAMRGNFMPAVLKIESGSFDVNSPINPETGDTLLHLSIRYSFYNVTRTLIEKFAANVNIQNFTGHTPLHIVCRNPKKDLVIFVYLLTQENIDVNIEDQSGLTALHYAIINNFNIPFMCLVAKGADLKHKDKMGDEFGCYAISNNNIFVLNFLLMHCFEMGISLNKLYFSNTITLSDILIKNGNSDLCEHIMTNYYYRIEINSIIRCCKNIKEFAFYNKYNYELINTLLYFRAGETGAFFGSLFPILCCCLRKNKKYTPQLIELVGESSIENQLPGDLNQHFYGNVPTNSVMKYEHRISNLDLYFCNYVLRKYQELILFLVIMYFFISACSFIFYAFYREQPWIISISIEIIATLIGIFSLAILVFKKKNIKYFGDKRYLLSNKENNIFHILNNQLKTKDIFQLPFLSEICEFCLTIKEPTTFHCIICNKCVKQYYFHSNLLDCCIHRKNVILYMFALFSIWTTHFLFAYCIPKTNIFFFILGIYFWIVTVIILGRLISLFFCVGYNIGFYQAYHYHEQNYTLDNMEQIGNGYYGIPKMNNFPFKQFIKNIFTFGNPF